MARKNNLHEGILMPDIYDPTLKPLHRDLLKHYGAVALPCRVQDPDRKGKSNRASVMRRRHLRPTNTRVRRGEHLW